MSTTKTDEHTVLGPIRDDFLIARTRGQMNYLRFLGGKPVCWVSSLPGAAFTLPVVTGEVLAVAAVLFLRRLLV